ncbi:MAG: SusC/RagA family TonB-linked outer membrane protein, partial [Chryseobacterium sp.]
IKGKLINNNGEAVIATIIVKGSKNATTTNNLGEFSIKGVLKNSILLVSGVNIEETKIPINGQSDLGAITISNKTREQEEVVVSTGYQKLKVNEINGSVVVLDNKSLNQQVGANILKRLDGITPGLMFNIGKINSNPQNTTNISVRGLSTINGPLDPLVVLDGFIYEGNIDNINPNDIESISVLKDATATSIWGARAGNGVIVISTKQGKPNQKLQVEFNSTIIYSEKPDLFYPPQIHPSDLIDVEQFIFSKGYFNNQITTTPWVALPPAVEIFLQKRNGLISTEDSITRIQALKTSDTRNDLLKYAYRNSLTQQYAINLRGGSLKNSYFFSVGYDRSLSMLSSSTKKLNVRLENTYTPVKNLRLFISTYYTNSRVNNGQQGYGSSAYTVNGRHVGYLSLVNQEGKPTSIPWQYRNPYIDTVGAGKLLDWKYYPLDEYKQNTSSIGLNDLFSQIGINYSFVKSLNIDIKYQHQKQWAEQENLATLESYEARNLINQFTQLNRSTGIVKYIVPIGGIRALSNSATSSNTFRVQLNYDKSWRAHSVIAFVGSEIREAISKGNRFTVYGYSADPLTFVDVDIVNPYPHFITGNPQRITGRPAFSSITNRFASFMGSLVYTFKNKYMISGSARRDGSNIFGANTNDKWKPLWSASAGWVVSKESFFKQTAFSYLKLRSTYGVSGNVDLSRTPLPIVSYAPGSAPTFFPIAGISSINNPGLRWEQSKQTNFGLDFALYNKRISGTFEYYVKKGIDLYGETPFDYTAWGGNNRIIQNVAAMKGKGFDINIQSNNIDKFFKWNTNFIFSSYISKTTKYFSPNADKATNLIGGGSSIIPVVGMPLYGIVAYKWGGLNSNGDPQGYLSNGALSTDYNAILQSAITDGLKGSSIVFKGSASPNYFGSLINRFSIKNIELSLNISYRFDYYFIKPSLNYTSLVNRGVGHLEYKDRWQVPGDELKTTVPAFQYPLNSARDNFYNYSEINVLKGDNVRLQYINLIYTLERLGNIALKSRWQVYGNVSNVALLWRSNKEKIDPDYPSSLRPVRTWAVGVRCIF